MTVPHVIILLEQEARLRHFSISNGSSDVITGLQGLNSFFVFFVFVLLSLYILYYLHQCKLIGISSAHCEMTLAKNKNDTALSSKLPIMHGRFVLHLHTYKEPAVVKNQGMVARAGWCSFTWNYLYSERKQHCIPFFIVTDIMYVLCFVLFSLRHSFLSHRGAHSELHMLLWRNMPESIMAALLSPGSLRLWLAPGTDSASRTTVDCQRLEVVGVGPTSLLMAPPVLQQGFAVIHDAQEPLETIPNQIK